jgi:hypothetical protein
MRRVAIVQEMETDAVVSLTATKENTAWLRNTRMKSDEGEKGADKEK